MNIKTLTLQILLSLLLLISIVCPAQAEQNAPYGLLCELLRNPEQALILRECKRIKMGKIHFRFGTQHSVSCDKLFSRPLFVLFRTDFPFFYLVTLSLRGGAKVFSSGLLYS